MKILFDTHIFLWYITDDRRLSSRARALLGSADTVLLSVASLWEILIKVGAGRLDLPEPAGKYIMRHMVANRIEPLAIQPAHVLRIEKLEWAHRDPFDRILVAQSEVERVPLLTADAQIRAYAKNAIWDK